METSRPRDLPSPNPLGWLPPKENHRQISHTTPVVLKPVIWRHLVNLCSYSYTDCGRMWGACHHVYTMWVSSENCKRTGSMNIKEELVGERGNQGKWKATRWEKDDAFCLSYPAQMLDWRITLLKWCHAGPDSQQWMCAGLQETLALN